MTGDVIHLWLVSWGGEGFKVYLRKPLSGGSFGVMCKGRIAEDEEPADAAFRIATRQISDRVEKSDLVLLPGRVEGEHVFMLKKKFEHYNTGSIKGEVTNIEISKLWDYVIAEKGEYNIDLYELAMVKTYLRSDSPEDEEAEFEVAQLNMCDLANEFSMKNKKQLEKSETCGCFGCVRVFKPSEVVEFLAGEDTAVCPYCGTDSVLGDYSGFPVTEEFMQKMNDEMFGEIMNQKD
ncbi:MAG: hypothetical protein Q4G33_00760 [bacterium]|nr:hypothetical protein [bacterium]